MHEVLVNRLGGLSLPRKSVVRLTDRPDMTLDVYRGRKTTNQQSLAIFQSKKKKKTKSTYLRSVIHWLRDMIGQPEGFVFVMTLMLTALSSHFIVTIVMS